MIFIDKMKNLKIYKTPMFLPTMENNKKKNSAVLLMTPSYDSSKKLITNPLFINRLRYSSYYIKRDVSYYINSKNIENVEESDIIVGSVLLLESMTTEERDKLKDSDFGLPSKRKYPLDTPEHVRSAIKFFNYVSKEDEEELANNIIKAIKKFNITDINVGEKNRFYKYYNSINEAVKNRKNDEGINVPEKCPECGSDIGVFVKGEPVFLCKNEECKKCFGTVPFNESINIFTSGHFKEYGEDVDLDSAREEIPSDNISTESFLNYLPESCLNMGDKVLFFNEDANDSQIYKMVYHNRLKKRQDVIVLYDQVKTDIPIIKYTFPEISKYQSKNLFVDLYFYNKIFFENNNWILNKGMSLYLTYMTRLINDPELKSAGYSKKTIMIPVSDWSHDPMIWNFRNSLNPMSVLYHLMNSGMERKILDVFGNNDILFVGSDKYFKINFSEIDMKDIKKIATTFKMFLVKMVRNEEFDYSDIDTSSDNVQSPEVIKANIVDKIELAKGIDMTASLVQVQKDKKNIQNNVTPTKKVDKDIDKKETDGSVSKLALNNQKTDTENKREADIKKLAKVIDDIGDASKTEEDAWDSLDDEEIKKILVDLDSKSDDKPDITAGRAGRISELDKKLLETEVKGKTIKEILEPVEKKEVPKMELNLSTTNEEWSNLSFVNFDKNYDIDRDIIRCFRYFEDVSRPISIRNIEVRDNSTSEDRVELYTVEMEDYRGKRFTIKLDIPIMIDNRFLLRGNGKTIQTQFFNMPIIKTDFDTCQVISNYMKIFVRRFGSGAGKSMPIASKFIKAVKKYQGRKIKFESGDNTKICSKYELPIDYIDISSSINTITTDDFIVYFNQDEIRNLYNVEEGLGVPYLYNIKDKKIEYYTPNSEATFIRTLLFKFMSFGENKYSDFLDLVQSATSPTVCSYSRCSIMNSQIPLIIICAYHEGLRMTLEKGKINYRIQSTLSKEDRYNPDLDWVKFKDGYVIYDCNYESSLLLNGLKVCPTDMFEIADIDNKSMYLEFLDNFGGRIKADGLENFYDLMIDPMTKDTLEFYKMPTDYVSILLYTNAMLADNKFIKHTDTSSRRLRRYILIAVYTYKVLADAYALYSNQLKHNRDAAEFSLKQSAVIDKFLSDTITSDDSCINALRDVETTNSVTTKGPSGMNSDRAYGLDKRTYDDSMLNILGMSTGFAGNVGITRQSTIDANVDENGYVISIDGNVEKMSTAKTLTATEALTPFGTTHDDPMRTAMTFIQTAKHAVRTEDSDPLLVTNGTDEAMPYITSDKFAFKAKKSGKVEELTNDFIIIAYDDGTKDFINLKETIEKNSDGGYYVPLKLDAIEGLKVGSKITPNQIVAYDKYSFSNSVGESDNLAYNIGKLAKVAVVNTDEGFEDSGVITEKMAQKLATRINLKFEATLDKEANIVSLAKIGDKVEAGDSLLVWQPPFSDEDANSLMKSLVSDDVSELGKKKIKSEVTGTVTGIKIFRTIELDDMSDSLRKVVEEYEKPLKELAEKLKSNNLDTSQIPAHYILPPTGKLKKAQEAVVIEFYVEYLDTVGVGDKIVYFSANKAVEKSVIPLNKEPYTDFRPNEPVDAFVSEVSIDKRIVCSSIICGSLQKLMVELDRSVKDIMGIPYDDSTV